jgi:hypothetical protein
MEPSSCLLPRPECPDGRGPGVPFTPCGDGIEEAPEAEMRALTRLPSNARTHGRCLSAAKLLALDLLLRTISQQLGPSHRISRFARRHDHDAVVGLVLDVN